MRACAGEHSHSITAAAATASIDQGAVESYSGLPSTQARPCLGRAGRTPETTRRSDGERSGDGTRARYGPPEPLRTGRLDALSGRGEAGGAATGAALPAPVRLLLPDEPPLEPLALALPPLLLPVLPLLLPALPLPALLPLLLPSEPLPLPSEDRSVGFVSGAVPSGASARGIGTTTLRLVSRHGSWRVRR